MIYPFYRCLSFNILEHSGSDLWTDLIVCLGRNMGGYVS